MMVTRSFTEEAARGDVVRGWVGGAAVGDVVRGQAGGTVCVRISYRCATAE